MSYPTDKVARLEHCSLDAELSRMLARCPTSPYWRYAEVSLKPLADGQSVRDYAISEGMKAYSFANLPEPLRGFLKLCDRSIEIEYELFHGQMQGTQEEMDDRVIARMIELGDIEES